MTDIYDLFSLKGKKAVVTGVSSPIGLGYAMVEALVSAGAQVTIVARSARCREAAQALGVQHIIANLARPKQVQKVIPRAVEMMGGLDILINNAGAFTRAPFVEHSFEDYQRVMSINLDAVFLLSQDAGKCMLAQGSGKIINVTSMNGFVGGQLVAGYAASKAGVVQLTRSLSNEWASQGINVNCVAPGYMYTEMTEDLLSNPERMPSFMARIPAKRWGQPEDIKGVVMLLSSAASDYIHGEVIRVDGGYLSQ